MEICSLLSFSLLQRPIPQHEHQHAAGDGDVGHIKYREFPNSNKINDVAETKTVEEIADGATEDEGDGNPGEGSAQIELTMEVPAAEQNNQIPVAQ